MFKKRSVHTRKCIDTGVDVRIDQSLAECQRQHGCERKKCPLDREFEPDRLEMMIAMSGTHGFR